MVYDIELNIDESAGRKEKVLYIGTKPGVQCQPRNSLPDTIVLILREKFASRVSPATKRYHMSEEIYSTSCSVFSKDIYLLDCVKCSTSLALMTHPPDERTTEYAAYYLGFVPRDTIGRLST